jgi:hypothetical protein
MVVNYFKANSDMGPFFEKIVQKEEEGECKRSSREESGWGGMTVRLFAGFFLQAFWRLFGGPSIVISQFAC